MKGNEQIELKAQRYLYERAHLSGSCVVTTFDPFDLKQAFIDGAEWQYEQFEKERLKHCDELTAEQAQIESDFVVQHLKNFNRTPTFIDAIEYGRESMRERITKLKELADKWDGHTPQEAADRLHKYLLEKQSEQKPFDYESVNIQQKDFAPKQEWSEEDENMAEDLIKGCVSAEIKAHHFLHTPKEVSDWLKTIKERIKGKED